MTTPADLPTEQKHLVLGAGFVGLGIARALRKHGIPYDQVDADTALGGNWRHGVYPHVHIISSKKTTEFTDYPMPTHYPAFPSAPQVLAYLQDYARHFELEQNMAFNKRVLLVRPRADELWDVHFADGERRVYKGIAVCNGHHWHPRHPQYPGEFTGEYMHSKDYKGEDVLAGKRVLVIGGGNSACDVAVDAARVAASAHISMRRGYWILPKSMMGRPTVEFMKPYLPVWSQRILMRVLLKFVIGNYTDYGLQKPDHRIFDAHPTLNSLLLYHLQHGNVVPHPDIARFDGQDVHFTDGTVATFDLIVASTGFHLTFPFFPKGLVDVKDNIPQLPQGIFHPVHKGLYIIGWGQARYGVGPLVTAGGDGFCLALKAQDQLERPLGAIVQRLGRGIPTTHIQDPMKALRDAKRTPRTIKLMLYMAKRMRWPAPYQPPAVDQYAEQPMLADVRPF